MSITIKSVEVLDDERMIVHLISHWEWEIRGITDIVIYPHAPGFIDIYVSSPTQRLGGVSYLLNIVQGIRPEILFCINGAEEGNFFDLNGQESFHSNSPKSYKVEPSGHLTIENFVGRGIKDLVI
jgi:hypothetical protein